MCFFDIPNEQKAGWNLKLVKIFPIRKEEILTQTTNFLEGSKPIESMGLESLPIHVVDFFDELVGKYTSRPMGIRHGKGSFIDSGVGKKSQGSPPRSRGTSTQQGIRPVGEDSGNQPNLDVPGRKLGSGQHIVLGCPRNFV